MTPPDFDKLAKDWLFTVNTKAAATAAHVKSGGALLRRAYEIGLEAAARIAEDSCGDTSVAINIRHLKQPTMHEPGKEYRRGDRVYAEDDE